MTATNNTLIISLLVTVLAALATFLIVFALHPYIKKGPVKLRKYKVHHSVIGVLLGAVGLLISNHVVASIGLGIYISHGLEEIYFNRTSWVKAFFIFVTSQNYGNSGKRQRI